MTDLDSPRRNNDCYFYYYSTCNKGDSCTFRHEPSALGCETMCSFWKEGKCLNVHCNFRHMELRKNRKAIQCYWETQPGGCLKPHCPFLHQSVKPESKEFADNEIGLNTDTSQPETPTDNGQASDKNYKNAMGTLVVTFEEESDNESAPSFSPVKARNMRVKVKTLEEIKLEKIQEESAAYFAYRESDHVDSTESEHDLRQRLLIKMRQKKTQNELIPQDVIPKKKIKFADNANTKTLEERLKSAENISLDEHILQKRKRKFSEPKKEEKKAIDTIKIKTLAEIRAERAKRQEQIEPDSQCGKNISLGVKRSTVFEDEVSSTSKDETENREKIISQPVKRIKLQRLPSSELLDTRKQETKEREITDIEFGDNKIVEEDKATVLQESHETKDAEIEPGRSTIVEIEKPKLENVEETKGSLEETLVENVELDSNGSEPSKLAEEVLLLDDDEDYPNVTLKAEDELLDEIDNIIGS